MKTQTVILLILLVVSFPFVTAAQVNSGSNGSDGAFNPTQNVTIDMNLRPDGIYHYTSVNIPAGVTVTFTQNANNTPVVWLVQGDCVVNGHVSLNGKDNNQAAGGTGGPGGWRGGDGGRLGTSGHGPGAGRLSPIASKAYGGNASFGTLGPTRTDPEVLPGEVYGNKFILPLFGGSGGGGSQGPTPDPPNGWFPGGGGGGGAILIASSQSINVTGGISSAPGSGSGYSYSGGHTHGGYGSGGAIRLVAAVVGGSGSLNTALGNFAGLGRIRIDCVDLQYTGTRNGAYTQGFQPIIIPAAGQGTQLSIQSIGGIAIGGSPSGVLANPDVIIPPQQQNPMNVVIGCSNLPLNTLITVVVRPANGEEIVATGRNTNGSVASSTVSIPVTMPRGGGIVYAKCVSGVNGVSATGSDSKVKNIAQTGWTADGETFAQMEIVAGLDGRQQVAYITESGKRYALPQD